MLSPDLITPRLTLGTPLLTHSAHGQLPRRQVVRPIDCALRLCYSTEKLLAANRSSDWEGKQW